MLDLDEFAKGDEVDQAFVKENSVDGFGEIEAKAEETSNGDFSEEKKPFIQITSLEDVEMADLGSHDEPAMEKKQSDHNLSVKSKRGASATSSFYNSWTNPDRSLFRYDRYEETINMKGRNVATEFESLDQMLKRTGDEQAKLERLETKVARGMTAEEAVKELEEDDGAEVSKSTIGTWDGVFASCILNIFGVIMFLRLPWIVGQAGIWLGCGIILLSGVVVLLTTLSMSAICTSGRVFEGGAYYLISRSLGPEIGAAVGIMFSIGLCVAVSMYVIGFCETLVGNLGAIITGDELNDIRIWGFVLVTICLCMVLVGIGWIIKLQLFLLAFICFVILSFFIGSFTETDPGKGVIGFSDGLSGGNFGENSAPDFRPFQGVDYGFFQVFGIFFPAVTGIMAGANISGDLENPAENIPKGTLYAVGISLAVYLLMAIFIGIVGTRDGEGGDTNSGLHNDTLVMAYMTFWAPLIYGGIYAATFTSALASLVGAPRVLYKVASDNILPISYFAKLDAGGNPRRGYFLAYGVACCCIAIGELNVIAPLITPFFMITYALINYSCFMLETFKSPGWRPSFVWFNKWTAIVGAIFCVVIMFLTDYVSAFVASSIAFGIYKYVENTDIDINWGTAMESRSHVNALNAVLRLRKDKSHIKNFRPNILVHTGAPDDRKHLLYFGQTLREFQSMLIYCNISIGDYRRNIAEYRQTHQDGYIQSGVTIGRNGQPLPEYPKVKGLFNSVLAADFRTGNNMALQLCGIGALKANTMMMGFKEQWYDPKKENKHGKPSPSTKEYVGMIGDTLAMGMGVMICRHMDHIDWMQPTMYRDDLTVNVELGINTIDVWWLMDDGGLSILIPHIMTQHKFWRHPNTHIRMLIPATLADIPNLKKLADTFTRDLHLDIHVEPIDIGEGDMMESPMGQTVRIEMDKIHDFKNHKRKKVTERWMRIAELVREYSRQAAMVFITCPYPKDDVSAEEFMSRIDLVSNIPRSMVRANPEYVPTVLIRGAAKELYLTYYLE